MTLKCAYKAGRIDNWVKLFAQVPELDISHQTDDLVTRFRDAEKRLPPELLADRTPGVVEALIVGLHLLSELYG